jgi:hypothetical protein
MQWQHKYPLVSVVIINWNYSSYVGAAIESVKQQDYPNLECLVVDNASTDDSVAVITDAIEDDARFSLTRLPRNYGHLGGALNILPAAQGQFICFLDADDVLFDNFLSSHIQVHLATDWPVSFTSSDIVTIDGENELICERMFSLEEHRRRSTECLPEHRRFGLPMVSDADYAILRGITFHTPPEIGTWCWSPGSANVIRRELLMAFVLDAAEAPMLGGVDGFFLLPLFAMTGVNLIGAPLSAYRLHSANDHARLPQLRGIRNGNEAAYRRNTALKRLALLNIINKTERIMPLIAPPVRYFRVLGTLARLSSDSTFMRESPFSQAEVIQAFAKQYPYLVAAFGERTVIRELRSIMKFRYLVQILSHAYDKRIPVATLRRVCTVGIRKRRYVKRESYPSAGAADGTPGTGRISPWTQFARVRIGVRQ